MNYYDQIIRPLVTEKTTIQKELNNQFSFEVSPRANRVEIKKAIEKIFNGSCRRRSDPAGQGQGQTEGPDYRQAERLEKGDCNTHAWRTD